MQAVPPSRQPLILALYALGGTAFGIGPGPMSWPQSLAAHYFNKPGLGTFASINLLMPLWITALAVAYPRYRTAAAGGIFIMLAFVGIRLLCLHPAFWTWTRAIVLANTSPIEVAAILGYIAIGAFVVTITKPWRRVALPDQHLRCHKCGYLVPGTPGGVCPECGGAFDPEIVRSRHRSPP